MSELNVERAENGFVVCERVNPSSGRRGKQWAFESAATLAAFIKEWGEGNTEIKTQPMQAG